jgi:hypothetical protein
LLDNGRKLFFADLGGLAAFALGEGLSDAENDLQAGIQSSTGLESDDFAGFVEDGTAFGVAEDHVGNSSIL